jgi:hypothetical protein
VASVSSFVICSVVLAKAFMVEFHAVMTLETWIYQSAKVVKLSPTSDVVATRQAC